MPHVVIFTPIVLWPVHLETDLEIAQRYLDQGWRVTFLQCFRGLPACGQNIDHNWIVCGKCISRFKRGIAWLGNGSVTVEDFLLLTEDERQFIDLLNEKSLSTMAEIRSIVVDGADIGLAALGSVISFLREPKPDVAAHRRLVVSHLQSAAMAFFSIRNQLQRHRPDKFIVFNGRFAEVRGALRASQSLKVPTQVHERAGSLEKFSLTPDVSPHDLPVMKRIIETTYAESLLGEEEKTRIAHEWYEERRSSKPQNWYSFTAHQRNGHLPDLAPDRCNVVIFNSSDDELEAFDEWRNPLYADQSDGIRRIADDLGKDDRFRLFLRVHPNLKTSDNSQTREIAEIAEQFPEMTVISAASEVSTYNLIDACDVVIAFGSTVGIEAAFARKPVFLMGHSLYEDLNCCIIPKSHEEFIRLLHRLAEGGRDMIPASEEVDRGVVKYGFFNKMWGEEYRYVKPCSVAKSVMVKDGRETFLEPAITYRVIDRLLGCAQGFKKRLLRQK